MNLQARFRTLFGREWTIPDMRRSYVRVFRCDAGDTVLPDLADFCGAHQQLPRDADLYKLGIAAGRRDVWLRIAQFLNLTEEELFDIYAGRSIARAQPE